MALKSVKLPNSVLDGMDLAVIQQMNEPLTIQIQRVKGGQMSPIPMPVGISGQSGVGWSREEVQAINDGWLLSWSGGGLYVITVTDASVPTPAVTKWKAWWNPIDYPEKVPPTLIESAAPERLQIVPQIAQPSQQAQPMQFPAGLPTGGILMQPQTAQPQPQYAYPPQYAQQIPFQPAPNYAAQAQQQRAEDELNRMREALNQQRLEAQAREHAAALERERTANQAAIQRLEQRIAELATANARPPAPTGPSPEILEMREQMRAQQAQLENERREREAERRENSLREQMRAQAEQTQRAIEAIQSQMAANIAAMSANKSDPMMQMMMEQNRNFTAALGEVQRTASAQADKFQAFALTPRDIIAMQKDSTNGMDGLTAKLTSVYSNVMDMQQRVIENAMQLNQGGSETVGLIREGITSVKEGFERYVGSKSKAEQVTQQSNAQTATANAQAVAIQAQAQVEIERLRVMGPPAAVQPQRPPQPIQQPANTNGLNGHGVPSNGAPKPGGASFDEWQRQQAAAQAANEASVAAQVPVEEPKYFGRTTLEWFTQVAIAEVKAVRDGVTTYIEGLKAGRLEGATPDLIVSGIMQASMASAAQGIQIPAFIELLNESKYDEFVQILIPNAPDQYKADVVMMLREKIDGDVDEDEDGDGQDDDDDDDGTQSDDVRDGSVVPPPKSAKPTLVRTPSA